MFKLSLYNIEGKATEELTLDKRVFDGEVNEDLLHQAVVNYNANRRAGSASTKTRGEVSGGGKKPWRQKGTGRARAGSIRSPVFRHGGVVFGPHPRSFSYSLPKKMRLEALRASLNARLTDNDVVLLEEVSGISKTKQVAGFLSKLGLIDKTLGVLEVKAEVARCMRNIANLETVRPADITAYDVLKHKKLLITKGALKTITERLKAK